jgi:hypothetical protein
MLALFHQIFGTELIKQPMPRDQEVTGAQMMNSTDHQNYYAVKPKNMTCKQFMEQNYTPDFISKERFDALCAQNIGNQEIVKLVIIPEVTFFVESYEALSIIKYGYCYVIDSSKMK